MDRVVRLMELERLIALAHLEDQAVQPVERPFIDRKHIGNRNTVCVRIKIGEIAEDVPRRVADLAVSVGKLLEDFR